MKKEYLVEDYCLVGSDAVQSSKIHRCLALLATCFFLATCFAYTSTLKTEAKHTAEE
jgi:uncharacterized lipoprotein YajG